MPSTPPEKRFPTRWSIPSIFTPSFEISDELWDVVSTFGATVVVATFFGAVFLAIVGTAFFAAGATFVGTFFVITAFFGAGVLVTGAFAGAFFATATFFATGAFAATAGVFLGDDFFLVFAFIIGRNTRKSLSAVKTNTNKKSLHTENNL